MDALLLTYSHIKFCIVILSNKTNTYFTYLQI